MDDVGEIFRKTEVMEPEWITRVQPTVAFRGRDEKPPQRGKKIQRSDDHDDQHRGSGEAELWFASLAAVALDRWHDTCGAVVRRLHEVLLTHRRHLRGVTVTSGIRTRPPG